MLRATESLLATMERPRSYGTAAREEDALVEVVRRFGGAEDLAALLAAFLRDPARCEPLLAPIQALGDAATAERLYDRCIAGGALGPEMPEGVLHALGWLGLPGVEEMLFEHARMAVPGMEWGAHVAAVHGLLNLPCASIAAAIGAEVRGYRGKNLFAEYVPALSYKTGDAALLEEIFELGATTASTDCNGGIILGVALYGEAGRPWFLRLMRDPAWEADSTGTGSAVALFDGLRCLGIGIGDLYREVRARLPESEHPRHDLLVLREMLRMWLARRPSPIRGCEGPAETAAEVHRALFAWSTPNTPDGLIELCGDVARRPSEADYAWTWERLGHDLFMLERQLEERMVEDALAAELAAARV